MLNALPGVMPPTTGISLESLAQDLSVEINALDGGGKGRGGVVPIRTKTVTRALLMSATHPDYYVLAGRLAHCLVRQRAIASFCRSMWSSRALLRPSLVIRLTGDDAEWFDALYARSDELRGLSWTGVQLMLPWRCGEERLEGVLLRVCAALHGASEQCAQSYRAACLGLLEHAGTTLGAGLSGAILGSHWHLAPGPDAESIASMLQLATRALRARAFVSVDLTALHCTVRGTPTVENVLYLLERVGRWVEAPDSTCAVYLEVWHASLFLALQTGSVRLGLWLPGLFLRRLVEDGMWTLICPSRAANLHSLVGGAFEALYHRLCNSNAVVMSYKARDIWTAIVRAHKCRPLCLGFKDTANFYNPMKHLGPLLCGGPFADTQLLVSVGGTPGVCSAGQICLPLFVDGDRVDFDGLARTAGILVRDLDGVSSGRRALAIGAHGLAEFFIRLGLPASSPEARLVHSQVFESIYWGALQASTDLAERYGAHEDFFGSPASEGHLQMDLRAIAGRELPTLTRDWEALRCRIMAVGLRNASVTGLARQRSLRDWSEASDMPQVVRRVGDGLGGSLCLHAELARLIEQRGLWSPHVISALLGSDQVDADLNRLLPRDVAELFESWPLETILDLANDRAAFLDQGDSLRVCWSSDDELTQIVLKAWEFGLKGVMLR